MRTQERSLSFDSWLQDVSAQIAAALASDRDAAAALLRIRGNLEKLSHAIRSDDYALRPTLTPVPEVVHTEPPPPPPASPLVRPYALVTGDPEPPERLAIEALVTATPKGLDAPDAAGTEWRWVVGLCQQPRSVAEVSAYGGLPLGVTRNVVGRMASAGLLQVQPPAVLDDQLGWHVVQRVLLGLRRL